MLLFFKLNSNLAMIFGISILVLGCGKKAETPTSGTPETVRPPQTQIDSYLEKQDVNCENNQACPTYISKIVVVHADKYKFCTGFLTADNTVATSSGCLPSLLRLDGQDCSRDVFFFFPKTANRSAERVGCSRVKQASKLDGQDPILWRDDVAFLELQKPLYNRRKALIGREGVSNNKLFTAWMVDQQGEFSAIIKKSTCESIHNNYVNPLVTNESSPSMIFADCATTNGSSGAPIIDNRGKIRAMISIGMDKNLRSYLESTGLLLGGLKEMFHATNFACATTPDDYDVLDEKECLKDLTYYKVDSMRSEMLSTILLFGELKKKYEESLVNLSRYVRFGVKLIPKGDIQETEIYPRCFKPLETWVNGMGGRNTVVDEMELPQKSFRRTMDAYGRIQGITTTNTDKKSYLQFSLKNLRAGKKSSVLMWGQGEEGVRTFQNISEECSNL